jgi:(p)ppGpp synthase/HD superfamily hydrolase
MSNLTEAILIATKAHRGQTSKDGEPYITHPLRVMFAGKTEAEMIVGVLHDVVEDTEVTLDNLRDRGFGPEMLAGVDAMTKRDGEDYMVFVARCKSNPVARSVKLADIADNMNLERIPNLTTKDFERYQKYRQARHFLLED